MKKPEAGRRGKYRAGQKAPSEHNTTNKFGMQILCHLFFKNKKISGIGVIRRKKQEKYFHLASPKRKEFSKWKKLQKGKNRLVDRWRPEFEGFPKEGGLLRGICRQSKNWHEFCSNK